MGRVFEQAIYFDFIDLEKAENRHAWSVERAVIGLEITIDELKPPSGIDPARKLLSLASASEALPRDQKPTFNFCDLTSPI